MNESSVMQRILLACSTGATRLFRNNTGVAWAGKGEAIRVSKPGPVMVYPGDVVIRSAQPIKMGLCVGSSDLIGWTVRDGQAVFTAIECKAERGRIRPEQQVFVDVIRDAGGIAGIARSADEARAILDRNTSR